MNSDRIRKNSAFYRENSIRARVIASFVLIVILFAILVFRLGWIQIISPEEYVSMAKQKQTTDEILTAKRGSILDRNGSELAVSTTSYKIWIRLKPVNSKTEKDDNKLDEAADIVSETLDISKKEIQNMFDSEAPRIKVAVDVTKDKADIIRATSKENNNALIEIEETSSRNYPLKSFAAHLIGSVNDESNGQGGIELEYNKYLSGIAGRWIKNNDASGNPIPGGEEIKYEKKDGLNVVLTVDESIQYYVEKELKKTYEKQNAKKVSCIVMSPKTGDILTMATYPNYDLNSPTKPTRKSERAAFEKMSDKEKTEYLSGMWRNPLISDLYEPGSIFKLVTVGGALEEGVITPNSTFNCSGSYKVNSEEIKCWISPGSHGTQTVTKAVANSCNPAMIQIIQRMGYDKFYNYLELFGITDKTGIDLPGEALPLIQSKKNAGPVGLATMSFGHGLSIEPLQMLSAVCAYGNDGKIMQPRIVKELRDNEGKTVKEFQPKVIRQVVSKKTTQEMLNIMKSVVSDTEDPVVDIPGYNVGAKTGSAQKLKNNKYQKGVVVGSVLTMAPIEDPQFAVLIIVDEPKAGEFGSTTAGPAAEAITKEVLRYLNIEPTNDKKENKTEKKEQVEVPKVVNMKFNDAVEIISKAKLKYEISGDDSDNKNFKIIDQYPKAGEYVKKGSVVYLYKE